MQAHRSLLLPVLFALGLAATVTTAPAALAQSDVDVEKLYKEGIALMKQGKDAEAEVKLQQCWDLKRTVDTATNLGELELDLGQDVEAATHLEYAEKHAPNSLSPALKKRIGDMAAKSRARVGALTFAVTPADALLAIDGKDVGRSLEGPTFVKPGAHEITASLAGYDKATESVSATAGQPLTVTLTLKTSTAATAPPPVAPPPPTQPPPPGGDDGGAPIAAWVTFGAGTTVAVVGGVLLAVGFAGQSGTKQDANALADQGGRCEPASAGFEAQCDDLISSQSSDNTLVGVGAGMLGVGAATAIVGLVWALTSGGDGADNEAATQLRPVASPDGAGLFAHGRF